MASPSWDVSAASRMTSVPDVRPLPSVRLPPGRRFAMCDGRASCRGERCTFAHSIAEREAWNAQLTLESGERAVMTPMAVPLTHTVQFHGPVVPPLLNQWMMPSPGFVTDEPGSLSWYASRDVLGPRAAQPSSTNQTAVTYAAQSADFLERIKDVLDVEDVQQPLTRENYKEKFHKLLCWEEKRHIEILKERCNGKYTLVIYQKGFKPPWINPERQEWRRFAHIEGMDGDQIAYVTQASEAGYIPLTQDVEVKIEIFWENFNHSDGNLYIGFSSEGMKALGQNFSIGNGKSHVENIEVQFEVKHSYFNSLHKAINGLSEEVIAKLVPENTDFRPVEKGHIAFSRHYDNVLKLDGSQPGEQVKALKVAAYSPPQAPPVLISGPFGTGKTRLLAAATYFFLQEGKKRGEITRVLVCAHHQASADTFLECYFGIMKTDASNPWRVELARITSKAYKLRNQEYMQFYMTINAFRKKVRFYARENWLLLITTCLTAPQLREMFPPGHFTHILLDEGAQAREPEAVAPLCLATRNTKIVITGDPQQVGPALLVLGKEARENGLKTSLLERLQQRYYTSEVAMQSFAQLLTNYRCHRGILDLSSRLFYGSALKCQVPDSIAHPGATYPLQFICLSEAEDPTEIPNESELKVVIEEVSQCVRRWPGSWGSKDHKRVCVVTPTRSQIAVLRELARRKGLKALRMLTTYDIQGQEFVAVFLNTSEPIWEDGSTRNPTKSICDPFVFNTVLTRAKALVVAVGNPFTLLRSEQHMVETYGQKGRCWSEFLKCCLQNNTLHALNAAMLQRCKARLESVLFKRTHATSKVEEPQKAKALSQQNPTIPFKAASSPARPKRQEAAPQTLTGQCGVLSTQKAATGTQKGHTEAPTPRSTSICSERANQTALPRSSQPATPKKSAATPAHRYTSEHQQLVNRSAASTASKPATDTSKRSTPTLSPGHSHPAVPRTPQTAPANTRRNAAASSQALPQTGQQANHPAVRNAPKTAVPSKGSPTVSPHQNEPKQAKHPVVSHTPKPGWSSSSPTRTSAYREQYPSLTDASKVPQRASKKLQEASQAARSRRQPQQQSPDFYLKNKDKLRLDVIKKELTCDNYKEKFQHLLCWEEKEHERILTKRCDGPNYRVTLFQHGYRPSKLDDPNEQVHVRYGLLLSESEECGDIMSYAKQASEGAEIYLDAQRSIVVEQVFASIPGKEDIRSIVIALTLKADKVVRKCYPKAAEYYQIPDQLSVKFKLKHSYFLRLQQNVDWLPTSVIAKLMPTKSHFTGARPSAGSMPMRYQQLKLDGGQLRALEAIACCNPQTPVLVVGPFGTGKTRLLARAAFQILQDKTNRVLVCAHHQASVDTFVEYFGEMKEDPNRPWWKNFVRIIPRESYRSNSRKKFPQYFKTMQELRGKSYHLVVTTLGKIPLRFGPGFFTHILLDEGAQTREPELIRPLYLANDTTRIIIAGDHFQVGPQLLVLGDEARKYGLGYSILERLHKHYQAIGDVAQPYCVTLLTNYRCHSGILMLPSSLYYGSTLQCRVPEDTAHPNYPFPLAFLCTSLEQQAAIENRNDLEVEILCNEVKTILDNWPYGNWGDKKPGDVCIMTPSADQKRRIHGKVRTREVEVLTAYDIQGRQYRAIFIGTFEALSKDGNPMNPTKSICDRYVFNTALTRAQSLVVVVGNPFTLLRTESHMVERYEEQGKCWTEYIRRCLECKTFYPPRNDSLSAKEFQDAKQCLYAKIYGSDTIPQSVSIQSDARARPNHHDSILVAYQRAVEEIPGCKETKLILRQSGKDLNWDLKPLADGEQAHFSEHVQMQEEGAVDVPESSEVARYTLRIQHYRKAEAVPFNAAQKVIDVSRPQHRRGAFEGDIVQAELFPDNPAGKHKGRIVRVLESTPNRRFVCTVFYSNSVVFCPIDKKNALIVNLPRLSKALLNVHHKDEVSDKLKSTDVVVFKANSLETIQVGKLPEIQTVIPLAVAKGMLFIVHVLHWNVQYRLPLGVVVAAVPKGISFFEAERMLKVVHEVEFNDQEDTPGNPSTDSQRDWSLPLYERALTVDPEQAVNLDDAISLRLIDSQEGASRYELAVHIVNAAKHINKDSIEDRRAQSLGTSVYGGAHKTMHMLSPSRRRQLSLDPGLIRDVISIVATVVDDSSGKVIMEGSVGVRKAQLRSSIRLSYKSAQKIMEHQQVNDELTQKVSHYDSTTGQPTLSETLQLLYKIAFSLRQERLRAAAAYSYEADEPEERCCWQTHMMIAELMIWANSVVAERVYNRFTDAALVRRQGAPNEEELRDTMIRHCDVLGYSHALQHHASQTSPPPPLLIPTRTLSAVREAMQSGDVALTVNLLTSDHLYPQLAVAQAQLRSIQQRAEYHCTSNEENKTDFHHYSLNLDFYTHFTSPMRRYIDIQLQRMLLTTLESTSSSTDQVLTQFNRESHTKLCLDLNSRNKNAKDFEKNMQKLDLAQQYTCSSEVLEAFVVSNEKGTIELCFPDLAMKSLSFSEKTFHVRNLGSIGKSPGAAGTTGPEELMWQVKITSLHRDFQFETQGLVACQDSQEPDEQGVTTVRLEMAKEDQTGSRLRMVKFSAIVSPLVTKLDPIAWGQVSKFVQNPTQGDLSSIREVITEASQDGSLTAVSEKPKCKFLIYHLKRSLARYNCIKVWMTYSTREAFLVPKLQLVELAPGVRICLEHNSHPAECFSDPQLRNASKPKYNDIREYVHLWEKVLLAEASEKSVKERQPVVIQDVRLKWPEFVHPKGMDQDHFEVKSKVALELPTSFVDELSEFFKIRVGDMVCVRYGCDPHSKVRSVFHMVVSNSPSDERRQATPEEHSQVQMKFISTELCRVSEDMKRAIEEGATCEMQIVTMSTSYQRVYKSLVKMKGAAERQNIPLACRIALGTLTRNKLADHREALRILRGDPLALTLWDKAGPPDTIPKLNAVQIEAMELALTYEFQLIQGPPGTGKSETGAHIAYVFAMLNRSLQGRRCVLYCGPSNKSVDVVLEKLHSLNKRNPDLQLKLLRICGRAVERRKYPGPYWNKGAYQVEDSQYKVPDWASEYLLHDKIRQNSTRACQQLLDLEEEFKRQRESHTGCIATAAEHKNYKLALKEAESEVLQEHFDIVLCTCNETASSRTSSGKFFTVGQCIIDECGMAFEPESMAPISLCEHVVLLGDHKQLQPVISYPSAKDNGLARSLFQRYAEDFEGFCHTLTVQYRMHDAICKFPSNCFYNEQLKTDRTAKARTKRNARRLQEFWPKGPALPLLFCNMVGREGEDRVGSKGERSIGAGSKFNIEEAKKVVEIAEVLHRVHRVRLEEMAILTPYSAQKDEIKKLALQANLLREGPGPTPEGIKVASITESQGDEYGIVILSTVRSQPRAEIANREHVQPDRGWLRHNLGFVTDEHQINVGITRSKYGLIIVGNETLLRYDDTWDNLLNHYKAMKCVETARSFPTKEDLDRLL